MFLDILDLLSLPVGSYPFWTDWEALAWRNIMPRKPLKPCKYPGCPKLCEKDYCEDHAGLMDKAYNKYTRHPDHNKRYGKEWRKIRNRYASAHPLCEMCLKEGRCTPVAIVHHIVPIDRGGTNDESNLMSLCFSHHEKIHVQLGDKHPNHQ